MNDSASRRNLPHRRRWAPVLLSLALGLASAARAQGPAPGGPIAIFFPPATPPLGSSLAADRGPAPAAPAPAGLAPYISDPFYAPLSTRLFRNELGADWQFRLEAYQASKTALVTELRAELATVKDLADPAVRERLLREFAREQTPRITELEAAAEQMRQDLCRSRSAEREYMRWEVDRAAADAPAEAELAARFREVTRMDEYYHEGLSPDQRRLLGAVALAGTAGGGWFAFAPDPALVRLPAGLPADLSVKAESYAREKAALESELLATLHPTLKTPADPSHVIALRALAAAQAPRFEALENQAEEIRRGLAVLQDPARSPDLPAVPPDFAERIAAHRRASLTLQQDLLARVDAVKKAAAGSPDLSERIRQAIAAFTKENAARYADLDKSKAALHAELAELQAPAGGAASADALQKTFSDSLHQLQSFWDYRDYQTAVFQPGLSAGTAAAPPRQRAAEAGPAPPRGRDRSRAVT